MSLMRSRHRSSAFTIIELLVVIAVIAVLATIVIVSYNGWRNSLVGSQIKNDLANAASAMQSEVTFNDAYPSSIPSSFSASNGVIIDLFEHSDTTFCIDGSSEDADTTYYIDQTLVDGGDPQEGTCATRPADAPPGTPTDVQQIASEGPTTINVEWTAPSGVVSGYILQCAEDSAFILNLEQSNSVSPSGSITSTYAPIMQFCRVRAVNTAG